MQETLQLVQQAYLGTPHRAVIVLEGWDTAGKGGVVRRLGWALDPRSFKVHAIAAPNGREKSLHYMQRFWERLPQHGQIVVFDRSWYGRVLVERVEGFATRHEWHRAYDEINGFEQHAAGRRHAPGEAVPAHHAGRAVAPLPQPADRSAEALEAVLRGLPQPRRVGRTIEKAIEDMVEKTSTRRAPWHVLPANNKPYRPAGRIPHHRRPAVQGRHAGAAALDPAVAEAAAQLLGIRLPNGNHTQGRVGSRIGGSQGLNPPCSRWELIATAPRASPCVYSAASASAASLALLMALSAMALAAAAGISATSCASA